MCPSPSFTYYQLTTMLSIYAWYLTSLSTIFQLYRGGQFIGGGNHRPVTGH